MSTFFGRVRLQLEALEPRCLPSHVHPDLTVRAEPHRFSTTCLECDNQKFRFLENGEPVTRLTLRAYPAGINVLDVPNVAPDFTNCPDGPPGGTTTEQEIVTRSDVRIRIVRESSFYQPGMQVVNQATGETFANVTYVAVAMRIGSNFHDIAPFYADGSIRLASLIDGGAHFADSVVVGPAQVLVEPTGEERPHANVGTLFFHPDTLRFAFQYVDGGSAAGNLTVVQDRYTQLVLDLNYNRANGVAWYEGMNIGVDPTADVQMVAYATSSGQVRADPVSTFSATGNQFLAYKDVRTSHNSRAGNMELTFGRDQPMWATPIVLEAEDGTGGGSTFARSNASGHVTAHLTRHLAQGQTLSLPFVTAHAGEYQLGLRYSMDNPNPVRVFVKLGNMNGLFEAQRTGTGGNGWNIFTHSPLFDVVLSEGSHTLEITMEETGGTLFGVELDTVTLLIHKVPSEKHVFGISSSDKQVYRVVSDLNALPAGNWVSTAPGQFQVIESTNYGPAKNAIVFGLGTDQRVYSAKFNVDGSLSRGWSLVGPGSFESFAVTSFGAENSPIVFGVATTQAGRQVYKALFDSNGEFVQGWSPVAPGQFRSLTAATFGPGRNPELFGIGINDQVYAARFATDGSLLNGWFSVAPGYFTSLSAVDRGGGKLELFGVGKDQRVYGAALDVNGSLESGWFTTAPGVFAAIATTQLTNGNVALWGLGRNQQLYGAIFRASDGLLERGWFSLGLGEFGSSLGGSTIGGRSGLFAIRSGNGATTRFLFDASGTVLSGFADLSLGGFLDLAVDR